MALCLMTSISGYGQAKNASLTLHCELDSVLMDVISKSEKDEISIYIANVLCTEIKSRYSTTLSHIANLEFDIPDGTYQFRFVIETEYFPKGLEKHRIKQRVYDSTVKYISTSKRNPTSINILLKNTCPFRRNIKNDVCPKCMSNENVIPICKGLPLVDYECHEDAKYSHCSPPACSPTWYCKTDKLEF